MSQAIFGLVGVVIGGLLTGAVNYALERRREARHVRAAARLILLNYRTVEPWIRQSLEQNEWIPFPPNIGWAYNVWLGERDFLASALSRSYWAAIEEGMRFNEDVVSPDTVRSFTESEAELLRSALGSAQAATAALASLAGRR